MAQCGDRDALETLCASHQPLVHALARRLCWNCAMLDELIQAGNLGLLRAAQRFSMAYGTKFSTYAVPWILGEIRSTLRHAHWDMVSLDETHDEGQAALAEVVAGEGGTDLTSLDLRLAIQGLCPEEQLLICLRYYRDKTQRETAALLHKSQGQISKIERHALEKLRKKLS